MKKILIINLLILSNTVFGQIPGKAIKGPIILNDTLTVRKGDIIYLGKGSDPHTGNFIHLYAPKNTKIPLAKDIVSGFFPGGTDFSSKEIPRMDLHKGFAGKQLVVESFSTVSSKEEGERFFGVINMKEYQFIEGIFFNDVVVDLGPAIRSGEVIKISAPELAERTREIEPLFSPFKMTRKGIEPVVVVFNSVSRNELYTKAIKWTNAYYEILTTATIITVQDDKITIKDISKNVQIGTLMGNDLFGNLPYQFVVAFGDNEVQMTFNLGGKNGDITAEDGEVMASISPSRIFDKNGEVRKMGQVLKIEAERIMNDLSYALVTYLLK